MLAREKTTAKTPELLHLESMGFAPEIATKAAADASSIEDAIQKALVLTE